MEFRATIRKGRVTLVPGEQPLVEGGALAVLTRAAIPSDVSLANLTIDEDEDADEREVYVEFLANDNSYARRTLKRWVTATGHLRAWFADEVFEPDGLPPARREASTSCGCCGLEMRDGSEKFWDMVLDCGFFPPYCFACGVSVPQWMPKPLSPSNRRPRRLELVHTQQDPEGEDSDGGVK